MVRSDSKAGALGIQVRRVEMKVQVVNNFGNYHGRIGFADVAAWDRNDFWIPVVIDGERHMIAKRDLVEA